MEKTVSTSVECPQWDGGVGGGSVSGTRRPTARGRRVGGRPAASGRGPVGAHPPVTTRSPVTACSRRRTRVCRTPPLHWSYTESQGSRECTHPQTGLGPDSRSRREDLRALRLKEVQRESLPVFLRLQVQDEEFVDVHEVCGLDEVVTPFQDRPCPLSNPLHHRLLLRLCKRR